MPSPILVGSIITAAMRKLGAIASNEVASAAELADGLTAFNDVLETLSTEGLSVWETAVETFNLAISQASYTIGSGGNFATTRPVAINNAYCTLSGVDFEVQIDPYDVYQSISVKTTGGGPVTNMAYVNDYPLGIIYVYPVPSEAMTLSLDSQTVLTAASSVSTSVSYPPGYARMLQYQLMAELAPEFGKELTATQLALMTSTKAAIKRANRGTPLMGFDSALTGDGVAIWQRGF
jgi:hypothetical protein